MSQHDDELMARVIEFNDRASRGPKVVYEDSKIQIFKEDEGVMRIVAKIGDVEAFRYDNEIKVMQYGE